MKLIYYFITDLVKKKVVLLIIAARALKLTHNIQVFIQGRLIGLLSF